MTQPQKRPPQNQEQSIKTKSKDLVLGSTLAVLIATIPFLFYINDIFPDAAIWETSFFTYQSKYYESVNVFVWVLLGKLIPLLLLIVWFLTCKHWWYLVVLVPIALYSFQLIFLVLEDSELINIDHFYYLFPFVILILSIIYGLRVKIFDRIHGIDLSELKKSSKRSWWNRLR